jgi:hypothetical protein
MDHACEGRSARRHRRCRGGGGEHQVLEGPDDSTKVGQINNRRPGHNEDLDLHVHQCRNRLAFHHASSLKNVKSKRMLSEEEFVSLMLYGDSQEMMEGSDILHGEFPLEGRYGLLQKCCVGCGEDDVISIKQQVYHI